MKSKLTKKRAKLVLAACFMGMVVVGAAISSDVLLYVGALLWLDISAWGDSR